MEQTGLRRIAPTNSEQARAWDGDGGDLWAAHADHFDNAMREYHPRLMDAAGIGTADSVLDVGCGTGQATRDAARRAMSGSALGVDLSAAMLTVARRRAAEAGLTNAHYLQADAQVHPFRPAGTDVVISRNGAMFFGDTPAAFVNLARALRRGGRLTLLAWQGLEQNEWIRAIRDACAVGRELPLPPPSAPGPFAFADPEQVRRLLDDAGFTDIAVEGLREPVWLGPTAEEATAVQQVLSGWMLADLDDRRQASALNNLAEVMRAHESPGGVSIGSAAWLVTARKT